MKLPEAIITEDHEAHKRVMDEVKGRLGVGKPREGVHVSDLIYCLRKGHAKRQLGAQAEETGDELVLVWLIGHSHEALLGQGKTKGLPLEVDGIIGTPDLWDEGLIEVKSTRSSAKKELMDMPHYLAQAAAYAAMHAVTEARVFVLHLMGDYDRSHPPQAQLRIWKVQFGQEELDRWWLELQRRRDVLTAEDRPGLAYHSPAWEWECGYCSVREMIGCEGGAEWQAQELKKKLSQSAK